MILLIACEAPPPEPELGSSTSALTWGVTDRLDPAAAGRVGMGRALALSGDWLAVTSRLTGSAGEGVVSLYERTAGRFQLRQELLASALGFSGSNEAFGDALALSGDTLAIGVPRAAALPGERERAGAVVVLVRSGASFVQLGEPLRPPPVDPGDTTYENVSVSFGGSLSLSGDTLAVGAQSFRSRSGRAYVFQRPSAADAFVLLQDLPAPLPEFWDPAWGPRPTFTNDTRFGSYVSLLGDRLLVAQAETSGHTQPGRIHTYVRSGGLFEHRSELLAPVPERTGDSFGHSFAQHGDTLVTCSGGFMNGQLFAYVFDAAAGGWTGPAFSESLPSGFCEPALSATRLVVGQGHGAFGVPDSVRVYARLGSSGFSPPDLATPGATSGVVRFGAQVQVDDSRVIASAPDFASVGAVFDLSPRIIIRVPDYLPFWRWPRDWGCLSCPPDLAVHFVQPAPEPRVLVTGGEVESLKVSELASAALGAEDVRWLALDAVTQRTRGLPDFVGLAADGTRVIGALGFAGGGLRTEQEVAFALHGDDGKLRPAARSEFVALYVAGGPSPGVFVLGGVDESGVPLRDLWRFDLERGSWSSLGTELPEELALPLAASFDSAQRKLYVAARGEQGNQVFALELWCGKPVVHEVEGLDTWVAEADALELALTPDGGLVIGASQHAEEGWAIGTQGCDGKLAEPVRGQGTLARGLRATEEGVTFVVLAGEPKATFLPYSALLPTH